MNYILFDGPSRNALLPFTFTRPVAELRIGILTIREKWEKYLGYTTSTITEDYLLDQFPMVEFEHNIMINASYLPSVDLVGMIQHLSEDQAIFDRDEPVAFYTKENTEVDFDQYEIFSCPRDAVISVKHTWDLFAKNHEAIRHDFELLTKGRTSAPIPEGNQVLAAEHIFIEEGAKVTFATLNASDGPIYIAKNAEVMEGSRLRGPLAVCEHATVKMGAKIYTGTTIGPYCKVGGEVSNSVLFGFSNKGHDGFLGNSVLGEWCNIGADSNTSNLKNNYAPVRLWDYEQEGFAKTGLQFCGLMMGDHSKCGINTMFNTGTVVGVSANIFGSGFPRNFVPSFSWGGANGFITYQIQKAFEVARVVKKRRNLEFTAQEASILQHVFEETRRWRSKT